MFTSKEHIEEKAALSGRGRLEYLQALVTEFQDTDSHDSKIQILANLANFAYDPINYSYMRKLNVIDLFLDMLTEDDDQLIEFGMGGLCNVCLDKDNKCYIIENDGVDLVIKCLSSSNENTVLNAITTLMFLITPASKSDILTDSMIDCMRKISGSSNTRLKNLAIIFLEDYCEGS